MKQILLFTLASFFALTARSQNNNAEPPYKRFPSFPPIKLLSPDSVSYFTKDNLKKKSAAMLMLFNPDCDHCRKETEEIIQNIEKFKNIQIVMATTMPYEIMKSFIEEYKLDQYDNISVGRDFQYFLPTFFKISNLPFLAFYNKNKDLISVFEGSLGVPKILIEFGK